jgi:hypothetical protein
LLADTDGALDLDQALEHATELIVRYRLKIEMH